MKQNRYILRKLIDAIKFCGAFELALRGHDEGVESNNPGIFRGLINLIAEVDDILKLHIDQSKNTVFMDINSNKKVLGTIRIDPSVPSLSIWSRAATAFAVASSKTIILLSLNIARTKHNNCLCPTLKFEPLSETILSKPEDYPKAK
jgi:hypothetical protein